MPLRARVRRRTSWRNHVGNQGVDPLRIARPETVEQVVELVREAEAGGTTIRAVGSGHSWSDVALTTGFLVETHGLKRCPDGPPPLLRRGADPQHDGRRLVWTEAGIRLRDLNRALHERGLALSNMGGWDAQTVAGVISTSTHGSGIRFGPIADQVRSLDLVASGGRVPRVEPHDGPTDPTAFASHHPERVLVQDDDVFHAAIVGMGCMGIVVGVMLAVEPLYCLREVRTLRTWDEVKADLLDLGERGVLQRHRHWEVLVNPYERDGRRLCLVTARDPVPCGRHGAVRTRNPLVELISAFPLTPRLVNLVLGIWPRIAPRLIDMQMKAIARREFENVSYKVLNIGNANLLTAWSSEIAVPLEGDCHVRAVERVFEVAAQRRELGDAFHSSAFSLRFVRSSPAYMSMMHGRDTMMIELILLTHTEGGLELMAAHEDALYALGGRPHWGQVNTLTGSNGLLAEMYPRLGDWLAVERRFNASGVFDSPFAKRVGIAEARFEPAPDRA